MSMQTTSDNDAGEPMMEINTTPLIDVMLVLLIMFIITIPIQTHANRSATALNSFRFTENPLFPARAR